MLSGDLWYLAVAHAKDMLLEMGAEEEIVDEIFKRVDNVRRANRTKNPMSGMF